MHAAAYAFVMHAAKNGRLGQRITSICLLGAVNRHGPQCPPPGVPALLHYNYAIQIVEAQYQLVEWGQYTLGEWGQYRLGETALHMA